MRNARIEPRPRGSSQMILVISPAVDVWSNKTIVALTARTTSKSRPRFRIAHPKVRMRMILSHMLKGMSMYDSSAVCGGEKAMRWTAQLCSGAFKSSFVGGRDGETPDAGPLYIGKTDTGTQPVEVFV